MTKSPRKSAYLYCLPFLIAVGACGWIYFGALADHLLDTHDAETFRDNVAISNDFSFFFSSEKEVPSGRPTAELTKWLAFLAFGNDPKWFHLLSVCLHGLATVLLAVWIRQLGESRDFSWCAALLFFVNVGHFQAVQYISAMDYPLALSLALAFLISFGFWYLRIDRCGGVRGWHASPSAPSRTCPQLSSGRFAPSGTGSGGATSEGLFVFSRGADA